MLFACLFDMFDTGSKVAQAGALTLCAVQNGLDHLAFISKVPRLQMCATVPSYKTQGLPHPRQGCYH